MKNYTYTILLSITLLIALATKGYTYISSNANEPSPSTPIEVSSSGSNENSMQETTKEPVSEKDVETATTQDKADNSTPEKTESTKQETPKDASTEVATKNPHPFKDATLDYFDNTLFIGDSRTVGLSEYGDLGNADVFADDGMSVYKIWNSDVKLNTGEKTTLESLLKQKKYDKIYIMLGINELGYDYDQTVKVFQEFIQKIQTIEPSAILYIEGNLHVTEKKSNTSDIYNNKNIDRFNKAISQIADNRTIFYIDVNELFDDESGSLAEEYTADAAHILAKYYKDWAAWLLTKAIEP